MNRSLDDLRKILEKKDNENVILIIRHLKHNANILPYDEVVLGELTGRKLNETGLKIQKVYSSPIFRAVHTTITILTGAGQLLPIETRQNLGDSSMIQPEELQKTVKEHFKDKDFYTVLDNLKKDEKTWQALSIRQKNFAQELLSTEKVTMVVTHGGRLLNLF